MKGRITLSIAFVVIVVLVSLMSSDSTVKAQPGGLQPIADTGVIPLGENQLLRVTAISGQGSGDPIPTEFRQTQYMQTGCSGGVCRLAVSSQTTSARVTLMPGEALSVAVDPSDPNVIYVRAVVMSNSRNVKVNAAIVDDAGHVVALMSHGEIDTW